MSTQLQFPLMHSTTTPKNYNWQTHSFPPLAAFPVPIKHTPTVINLASSELWQLRIALQLRNYSLNNNTNSGCANKHALHQPSTKQEEEEEEEEEQSLTSYEEPHFLFVDQHASCWNLSAMMLFLQSHHAMILKTVHAWMHLPSHKYSNILSTGGKRNCNQPAVQYVLQASIHQEHPAKQEEIAPCQPSNILIILQSNKLPLIFGKASRSNLTLW